MISDRLAKLQAKLDSTSNIPEQTRTELTELIGSLKAEIEALPEDFQENARSIEDLADTATQAAVREGRTTESAKGSLDELSSSVEQFEASHPELTGAVQRLANVLSNMGI